MTTDRNLVQIEAGEDVHSVRDRLGFLRGQRVLIVWPEEGTALTRKLDLVLVQREAMRRAIRLAIVTHDPQVIRNARELNISTFETIGESERKRWKRGRSKVFTHRYHRPENDPDPEELMDVASRVRIKRPSLSTLQSLLLRLFILGALVGVVLAVGYIVIPGATVTLTPAEQQVRADVLITVNTDPNFNTVDIENAILPAVLLETNVEETARVPTTGTQVLGDISSVGTVVFINNTGSVIDIPEGTVVTTSAGTPILFRTTQSATLAPGDGQQVEVPIEAMPGSEGTIGNVAENLINTVTGPLEDQVTVRNLVPTSGGVTRTARVVTQADRELVMGYVRQQLQDRAYNGLLNSPELSNTHYVILETLRITEERADWTNYSANVGDIADTLTLTMRATLEVYAFDEQVAQQIVFAQMARQIPRGRVIQPESIEFTRGPINTQGDRITFTLSGTGVVTGQINAGQLQQQLAGRSLENTMAYLNERVDLAEDSIPEIRLSPDWFDRMPILPMRIQIDVRP